MDFEATITRAVEHLASDGFLAYPTETVWGLGACADRPVAIERLLSWKRRASETPLAVLVASAEASIELGCELDPRAEQLMDAFWPGPLMIIVPCRSRFAPGVARADGALGLRCSPHRLAHALCVAAGEAGLGPLTSTSLNRTGEPAAGDLGAAEAAIRKDSGVFDPDADPDEDPDPAVPMLISVAGHDAGGAKPSSVVDCTGARPKVLRVGAIDREQLEQVWA